MSNGLFLSPALLRGLLSTLGVEEIPSPISWKLLSDSANKLMEACQEYKHRYEDDIRQAYHYHWPLEKMRPNFSTWVDVPSEESLDFELWVYRLKK